LLSGFQAWAGTGSLFLTCEITGAERLSVTIQDPQNHL